MSTTSFPQNDALAVKLWARVLETEALKYTAIRPLIGSDENSVIHLQNALSKGPGDQITYAIVMQLAQAGFTENQLAEGNGEALTTYSDALVINESQTLSADRFVSAETLQAPAPIGGTIGGTKSIPTISPAPKAESGSSTIRAAEFQYKVPIDRLVPGTYLLTFDVAIGEARLRRDVIFQVKAGG